ncbi:MAG: LCP family protein [Actinobacteria bacterium]|nr:LCP family protein [Actinomycetota bacterium]
MSIDHRPAPAPAPAGDGWGRVARGGRRRRVMWRRIAITTVVVLALLLVGTAGLVVWANGQIERIAVAGLQAAEGPTHVLVVGSDSREGLTAEEQVELTTGFVEGERTDTIFVMSIQGGRVALLAFPRDLWVTRCDGTAGRINAAFGIGGPDCLVQTVSQVSGLPIQHYLEVNFGGFRRIVDAVGGVELCLERAMQDPFAGVDLPAGCQLLDGRQALGFVRTRKIDNDLERIKRQQEFLRALASKLASPGRVLNPFELVPLTRAVGAALTADEGMGPIDLLRLGLGLRGLAGGAAVTHTVPVTGANRGGAAVLVPVEAEAEALFQRFRNGSILDDAVAGLQPNEVEVSVQNGAGTPGLAAATRDLLTGLGFVVTDIADAPEPVTVTTVRYPPGQREAAELLADRIPVTPQLVEDAEVARVTLIAGPDLAAAG